MIIFTVFFGIVGAVVMILSYLDIAKENSFKKNGTATKGKVVDFISASHKVMYDDYTDNSPTAYEVTQVSKRVLLNIENSNGEYIYHAKTKKSYKREDIPDEVEIIYDPEDPSHVMIDGFYASGIMKYLGVGIGAALIIFSIFLTNWFITSVA